MRGLGAAAVVLVCALVIVVGAAADADQTFTIEAVNSPVPEDGTATFKISLSDGVDDSASVTWSTIPGGSAVANQDYVPQSPAQVTVPKASSVNVSVPIVNDGTDEGDEEFSVQLSDPSGASLGTPSTASATITDNDPLPSVSIGDASADEGAGTMSFSVTLSAASGKTVKVTYATEDDSPVSAAAGSDYTAKTAELTFTPGDTSETATVAIANDAIDENNETFKVRLSALDEATGGAVLATGTIMDNDGAPTVNIENANAVSEGGVANFTVRLTAPSVNPVRVDFATENDTAVAPGDFTAKTGFVQWAAGNTDPKTVTVQTVDDTGAAARDEPNETFRVLISNPQNATIGSSAGTGTINDNDAPPTARVANAADVTEGDIAKFTVTLDGPSGRDVRVSYRTANGSAVAGSDYDEKPPGSELVIPAGLTTKDIEVKSTDDTSSEGDETFQVLLGAPNETVQIGSPNAASALIKDNDALRTVSITGAEVTEGTGGTVNLDFKVTLSGTTSQRVAVTATAQDGSAVAPNDYQQKSQRLEWAENTTALQKTFSVLVNGDSLDEKQETLIVRLESPQNATILTAQATGLIRDNDNRSVLSISDAEANEGSGGTTATMTFKVTLSPVSDRPVNVSYATANGTATAGSDYTAKTGQVTFAEGETEKTVEVSILGDEVNEENETVFVNITGSGAGIAAGGEQGQGTIIDKNAPPSLSISDTSARESEGATFTVTLAGTTVQTVTVRFGTVDGTAKAGSDYVARVGTLTFAPGEKTKAIAVTVLDDTAAEIGETFFVTISDPVNAAITKRTGTASIEASDQVPTTPRPPTPVVKPVAKTTTLLPKMLLGPRTVTIAATGVARMLVTCNKASPIACSGTVSLETAAKPKFLLGKKTFSVKKGKKVYVPIKLSARGLKRLMLKGKLQAKAIVVVKTSAKNLRVVPGVITLKLKPGTKFKFPVVDVIIDAP